MRQDNTSKTSKSLLVIFILLAVIVILVFVIITIKANFDTLQSNLQPALINSLNDTKNILVFILSFIIGILGSLISGLIFLLTNRRKKSPVETLWNNLLRALPDEDLKLSLIKDLAFFGPRKCTKYRVEAALNDHNGDNKFFKCTVTYNYTKFLSPEDSGLLKFRIKRTWEEKPPKNNSKMKPETYVDYEHWMEFDELQFHNDLKEWKSEDIYNVTELFVSTETQKKPEKIDALKKVGRHLFGSPYFDFEAKLPDWARGEVELTYTVQFVIEKTSFAYFPVRIPTKGFEIKFNYSAVKDQLAEINCVDFLSSYESPVKMDSNTSEGVFKRAWPHWIIPKSSFIFIWSKK